MLITAILVKHLLGQKTGLDSDILIDRIIRVTMQTGLATVLCATISLILFLTDPIGLHLAFNFPLCKIYTNSLLSSLNARGAQRRGSADSADTGLVVSKNWKASLPPPPVPQFYSQPLSIEVESVTTRVSDADTMGLGPVARERRRSEVCNLDSGASASSDSKSH
ncbi:hypothetical protein R3P38DRAFT_481029 [Favolaschia claudopus]|uniref:DUF6534 domain-containing protein n=1 Tax=Favolaschia claudopus TaxID=2862362 RepID=A0AAW0CLX0_9AGAR